MSGFNILMINSINKYIYEYIDVVSETYSISKKELMDLWEGLPSKPVKKEATHHDVKIKTKKEDKNKLAKDRPKRRNAYQTYFMEKQKEMKNTNPELSFGECSSVISKTWNGLSKQDQEKYSQKASYENNVLQHGNLTKNIIQHNGSSDKTTHQEKIVVPNKDLIQPKKDDMSITYLDSKSLPCIPRSEVEKIKRDVSETFLFEDEDEDDDLDHDGFEEMKNSDDYDDSCCSQDDN